MSFEELDCKKSLLDALPSLNQRLLAADMICSSNFQHFDLVRLWYTSFGEDIYSFGLIIALVIGLYVLIFFPVSQKILVPSFVSLRKRMNVTSIFMAGVVYPVVFNYGVLFMFRPDAAADFNFGVISTASTIGSAVVLMSLVFGILHHFANEDFHLPSYPIFIWFAFIAAALLLIGINGVYGATSWVFSLLLFVLFGFYLFAIQWAEKKEVEQLEKNRKANEALENFQRMMGGGWESDDLEKAAELRRIRQQRAEEREKKTETGVSEQLLTIAFDPSYHWLHNLLIGPILLLLFCFVPYSGNPLMKTFGRNYVVVLGIFAMFELNFRFIPFWGRVIIVAALAALVLYFREVPATRKMVKNLLDFFGIIVVVSLSSEMQLWVDDTITFFNFYFSFDLAASYAFLNAIKGVIVDTGTNIQLVRLGYKEALLNVYASAVFQLFVGWPVFNLFMVFQGNHSFPIFGGAPGFLVDSGGVTWVTHTYSKALFGFVLILLVVKTIYYVVSNFKLNVYIRRTLYSIYATFIAMTFYYGTLNPAKAGSA